MARYQTLLKSLVILIIIAIPGCSKKTVPSKMDEVSIPKGWYLSLYNSNIDLIKAEENKNGYRLLFNRTNDIKDADYYIRIAEGIFPDRDVIIKSDRSKSKYWYFDRLWWFEKYKGYLIPFSVTGDTVNYYIVKYKNFKENLQKSTSNEKWKASSLNRVEFQYTASAVEDGPATDRASDQKEKEPVKRVRVTLNMRWYEYCGQPCGWGFEKKREIVFDGKNKVTSIRGDGFTQKWISTKQTPYAPDQWIRY
ncbi:hypothetical protein KKA14_20365 [bacterium]|nr:hypothetical protein [bacterium]